MDDNEDDIFVQLFEKDDEILELRQQLAMYKAQNENMKKTIDTIIKKKCKRSQE